MNDVSHWDYLDDGCPTRQKVSPVVAGHWWSSERNAVGSRRARMAEYYIQMAVALGQMPEEEEPYVLSTWGISHAHFARLWNDALALFSGV